MPALSMVSVEKVATPFTAVTLVVPERVPPPGFVPSATVTVPVNPVAVFPCASSAVTCTAGVIAAPAVVLFGGTVKTSWAAAPDVTLNAALVAGLTALAAAVSVYPVPLLFTLRSENVATPATGATVLVPESVPPPGLAPSATVTLAAKPGTVFPNASWPLT